MSDLIKESAQVMKKCQAGTNNYDKANNLHAECYGTIGALLQEIERLRTECDHLRQQAQTWKMEAQTMTSIVNECYQAATGKTGEPGTWNGSNPVVGFILLLQQRIKMLRYAGALLSNAAYNLAQRQGRVLSESDCSSLNDARVTWDQMQR